MSDTAIFFRVPDPYLGRWTLKQERIDVLHFKYVRDFTPVSPVSLPINPLLQAFPSKVENCSAGQKIPCLILTRNFITIFTNLPLNHILSQLNPFHTFINSSLRSILILSSTYAKSCAFTSRLSTLLPNILTILNDD